MGLRVSGFGKGGFCRLAPADINACGAALMLVVLPGASVCSLVVPGALWWSLVIFSLQREGPL